LVCKILIPGLLLPSAALALGLGDIHVESALHQPLAAQIEIVGATPDTTAGLTATIADAETFQRYGLERPASLASTALTVRQDGQGHAILLLRSTDTFTEPMVTFLVDLHSPSGELIREYTVLLDPPAISQEHATVESTSGQQLPTSGPGPTSAPPAVKAPAVTAAAVRQTTAQDVTPTTDTYTVARRDTLDRIAGIAGAHSRSDRRRMMIAIFRANPSAFQTNLNNLRSGVTLHLPSVAELSKIPADEANREFAAQMAAWRSHDHRLPSAAPSSAAPTSTASASVAAPVAAAPITAPASPVAEANPDIAAHEAQAAALTQRVESLEKSLDEVRQKLRQSLLVRQQPVEQPAVESTPEPVAAREQTTEYSSVEDEPAPAPRRRMRFAPLAAGIGLALAAGIWFYRRRRSDDDSSVEADVEQDYPVHRDPESYRSVETGDTPLPFPKIDINASYLVEEMKGEAEHTSPTATPGASGPSEAPAPSEALAAIEAASDARRSDLPTHEPTVKLAMDPTLELPTPRGNDAATTAVMALHPDFDLTDDDTAAREFAFFNPESSNNTTHVMLASGPQEAQPFVERRKNPADVLRQAIEREPERSDLRLKLLELYYTAAAQNRRAFLEAVRQLAKNEKLASPNDWSQIADMGRTIAPDDALFANGVDNKKAVA
jgi:pilus assembly protein FimV